MAKAALAPKAGPVFREIPITSIFVGKNNFRQDFDAAALKELADSVVRHGVAEPLLVRDNSRWQGKGGKGAKSADYDLIAGERRLRAAKMAGLEVVPAMVHDVDDATADELMVMENLQRRDLSPLEYADGFERMIKRHGYTVEQLAEKADKGTTFIRDLLHLARLPDNARAALREERITKSVAVLIATVPDEKQRQKFAKEVLQGGNYQRGSAMTFREAKDWKESRYMKVLSGAPFALDEQIDPDWPHSCRQCPHFGGNTPGSQQGKRTDVCLNPPHYERLVQIAAQRKLEAAEAKGATVLPANEAKRVFSSEPKWGRKTHGLRYDEKKYVDANDTFHDANYKSHQYSSLIKPGNLTPVIAIDPSGYEHRLLVRSEAEAAIRQLGLQKKSAQQRQAKAKPSVLPSVRSKIVNDAIVKALAMSWEKASIASWRAIAKLIAEVVSMGDGGDELVALALGAKEPKHARYSYFRTFLEKRIDKSRTRNELLTIIAALAAGDRLAVCEGEHGMEFGPEEYALGKALGMDFKALEAKALKEAQAQAKAAKKAAKKKR